MRWTRLIIRSWLQDGVENHSEFVLTPSAEKAEHKYSSYCHTRHWKMRWPYTHQSTVLVWLLNGTQLLRCVRQKWSDYSVNNLQIFTDIRTQNTKSSDNNHMGCLDRNKWASEEKVQIATNSKKEWKTEPTRQMNLQQKLQGQSWGRLVEKISPEIPLWVSV